MGRQIDCIRIGFSARKSNLSLYSIVGIKEHTEDLKQLGKQKTGVVFLYINKPGVIDLNVLNKMTDASIRK